MSGPAGARPRVLLVEDNPELADMLGELLRAEGGCAVGAARDGQSAPHFALNAHHDVAVLDRGLPHGEGLELLARLRGSGRSSAARCSRCCSRGRPFWVV